MEKAVLITLGGTSEAIDQVRSLRNTATGTLGVFCAKAAEKAGFHVTVIASETVDQALLNQLPATIELFYVSDVTSLEKQMTTCLQQQSFFAVIHTMAVGDYIIEGVYNEEGTRLVGKKLSSEEEVLNLRLKKAPKIIEMIKKIQPNCILIGFKLLVDATTEELFAKAQRQIQKAHSDYVVMNNVSQICGTQHCASITDGKTILYQAKTKQQLAQQITHIIKVRWQNENSFRSER